MSLFDRFRHRNEHARAAKDAPTAPPFGPDFETKLEALAHLHRKLTRPRKRPKHARKQRGSGIEFVDHRDYELGDDPRVVDWNATARLGHLLVRINEEHEDLTTYVLLDSSRSMSESGTNCFRLGLRLTAALSYLSLMALERVMVGTLHDGTLDGLSPQRGMAQLLTIMRYLKQLAPQGNTDLVSSVRRFTAQHRRPGQTILISDLAGQPSYDRALDLLRYSKHRVHVVCLRPDAEAPPLPLGDITLVDSESGEALDVTLTAKHLQQYRTVEATRLATLTSYCLSHQIQLTLAEATAPFDKVVRDMLRDSESTGLEQPLV